MQELFNPTLKRNTLVAMTKEIQRTESDIFQTHVTIHIHRNHAFEPIQSIIMPFLHFSGIYANFVLSSYDDSLNFDILQTERENTIPTIHQQPTDKQAALEFLFIDTARYTQNSIEYIAQRVKTLRSMIGAPIIVLLTEKEDSPTQRQYIKSCKILCKDIAQCEVFGVLEIVHSYYPNINIFDNIKADITGTRLNNAALLALAQILGLSLIPSFILPRLKALALDLDNTLYHGILGEDGIDNIMLHEAYIALQEKILDFKKQGFLLALVSKNEESDVRELFAKRKDFKLSLEDFDCIKVNWKPKSENLKEIARGFNIGLDSILFIDDNIAEIENVKHTGVKSILATNPSDVIHILSLYPQLRSFNISNEDKVRSKDISANAIRKELENLSQTDYFRNLMLSLSFTLNDRDNVVRITELLNKTNQFIATFLRPTQQDVLNYMDSNNHAIMSIAMNDRLSDSGIIAVFIAQCENNSLHIVELCISCRALGRRLEDIMLFHTFRLLRQYFGLQDTHSFIHYVKGPRNTPFLNCIGITENDKDNGKKYLIDKNIDITGLRIQENGLQ